MAGLFEGFVRDACVNGSVLLSLIVLVAGFVTSVTGWAVAGVLIGVTGIVLPWLSVYRRWPIPRVWLIVAAVVVVDCVTLTLMWTTS